MELIYTKSINNNKIPNNYKADAAAKIQEPIYTIINIINKRGDGWDTNNNNNADATA